MAVEDQKSESKKVEHKKIKKHVPVGVAYVSASLNNTMITITDESGNVLVQQSAGKYFTGAKKTTSHAANFAAIKAAEMARDKFGMKELSLVNIEGPGAGRDHAVRALSGILNILYIRDNTKVAHNGCRLPKSRNT